MIEFRFVKTIFAILFAFGFVAPAPAQQVQLQLGGAVQIRSAADLIENHWQQDQHLYVKGNLGIGKSQLASLEKWLDENGPHWTIVLMANANNESYRSLDNRRFRGMDAVEYALGRGLALRTNFSELVDSRTGETDGAVFVLFLAERKFSYYASEAQDTRRLGESHWVGELDRPAFRAMRGGGRIIDAVKNTVSSINHRLTDKIKREAAQAELEKRARKRRFNNLKADLADLKKSIETTSTRAAQLRTTYPEATGELTKPPIVDWNRRLTEIDGNLSEDNVAKRMAEFESLSHEVEGFLNAYAEYDTFDEILTPIATGIDGLDSHSIEVGKPMAEEATSLVAQAKEARQNGDRGLAQLLEQAKNTVARGNQTVAEKEESIRLELAAKEEERRRAEERKKLIWRTILTTAALLTLAFIGVLYWLNRRRVPAMKRARETFAEREKTVKGELDRVYELFGRSNEVLGSKEQVEKRRYEGTTKKLTDNTFEDVDDLIVMSSEVERVMSEAREMIHPKKTTGKIANMFSGERYEQGVNHISGKPLKFHRDKGLPLVIQRESERTGGEPPEEVTMTFDKVFQAFNERTTTAEETLDTIEQGLMNVNDKLESLRDNIELASSLDRELADLASDDGMFSMPAFFEKLIPSAQEDYDKADDLALADPVQAMQVQIPSGERKISEATSIAKTVQHARDVIFPKLNQYAPELQKLEYNTNWIQQTVAHLGEQANRTIEQAVDRSVADEAQQFSKDVDAFGERARLAVELAHHLKDEAAPKLDMLEQNIADARREIASALAIPEGDCLQEFDAHPDSHLAHGRKLMAAAQAALQHGGVDAATQAKETLHEEVESGQLLIDRSLRVLREFETISGDRKQELERVENSLPRREAMLSEIRREYADSALVLQAGDASYEDPSATVDTHLADCHRLLGDATELVNDANEKFRKAHLIAAANMLEVAANRTREGEQRLEEIDQHCTLLKNVSNENESKLTDMQRESENLRSKVNDRRTMQPTIAEYHRVVDEIQVAQQEIRETKPRDPFRDSSAIGKFSENVVSLAAKIDADADAYAEAARAVEGAKKERLIGQQLIDRSRSDGIPDSPATKRYVSSVQQVSSKLKEVEQLLAVDHNDWKTVDHAGAKIHSDLGIENAKLRGELDRAQRSVDIFQSASASVFDATRWTGGFGVRIFGSPGSSELERARAALNQGNYNAMIELARAAQMAASHAIERAQREVHRKKRQAARAAEAARRRRRERSISIGGGGIGGGIGGGRIGGGSMGGGIGGGGGISSGSSGSGFSRSGW